MKEHGIWSECSTTCLGICTASRRSVVCANAVSSSTALLGMHVDSPCGYGSASDMPIADFIMIMHKDSGSRLGVRESSQEFQVRAVGSPSVRQHTGLIRSMSLRSY